MLPRPTIEAFDRHLVSVGLRFEGVIIGGSALVLMGVISRLTKDVDVVIINAARDFAKQQRQAGNDVADDWLNNGPMHAQEQAFRVS